MAGIFSISGIGLHTGARCSVFVTLTPKSPHNVFRTASGDVIANVAGIRRDAHLATDLAGPGGVLVRTVEHLLCALCAVTEHAIIDVDGPEIPILDGSADVWLSLLIAAGASLLVKRTRVSESVSVAQGLSRATFVPANAGEDPLYRVVLDFPGFPVGTPWCTLLPFSQNLQNEVAGARTFAFAEDIEKMHRAGFALGGSLDNALVIDRNGSVNGVPMRYENEPARHKMLDVLGDLSLLGGLPYGHVSMFRPGHQLTHALLDAITKIGTSPGGQATETAAAVPIAEKVQGPGALRSTRQPFGDDL